jgi:hypothetical protein
MREFGDEAYEAYQRVKWFIYGIDIHGLSPELFAKIPTERLCELYNVELTYFRRK